MGETSGSMHYPDYSPNASGVVSFDPPHPMQIFDSTDNRTTQVWVFLQESHSFAYYPLSSSWGVSDLHRHLYKPVAPQRYMASNSSTQRRLHRVGVFGLVGGFTGLWWKGVIRI